MTGTRARILETALGMFNEQGVHRVGVRDVARALAISPGNLAYHFATKDALVAALVKELSELNARTVFAELPEDFSLETLYQSAVAVMRNMLRYRFVLRSYVDAVGSSSELQKLEATLRPARRARSDAMMARLVKGGYLDGRRLAARGAYLYEQSQMVSSGWLNAAEFRPDLRGDRAVVLRYAKVGLALLDPYCTPKGLRQMRALLAGGRDAEVWPRTGAGPGGEGAALSRG